MNNYCFYERQHPSLKIFFVISSLLFTGFVELNILAYSALFMLIYISFKKKYILSWLKAVAKISPLLISIIIAGFIFSLPFPQSLGICLRILFLIMISINVLLSIPRSFLATMAGKHKSGFYHDLNQFLWKTSLLIPEFLKSFKDEYEACKPDFIKAIVHSFSKAHINHNGDCIRFDENETLPRLLARENYILYLMIAFEIAMILHSFL